MSLTTVIYIYKSSIQILFWLLYTHQTVNGLRDDMCCITFETDPGTAHKRERINYSSWRNMTSEWCDSEGLSANRGTDFQKDEEFKTRARPCCHGIISRENSADIIRVKRMQNVRLGFLLLITIICYRRPIEDREERQYTPDEVLQFDSNLTYSLMLTKQHKIAS